MIIRLCLETFLSEALGHFLLHDYQALLAENFTNTIWVGLTFSLQNNSVFTFGNKMFETFYQKSFFRQQHIVLSFRIRMLFTLTNFVKVCI